MSRPYFTQHDFRENRMIGSIGVILFFVPLIVNSKSSFNRCCANQGLLGTVVYAALTVAFWLINLILGWIPLIGALLGLIGNIAKLAVVAIMAYHAYLAYQGKFQVLPYIGEIDLIK